jgi:hypothetical protein
MVEPALSQLYGDSRASLLALVSGLDERGLATPVPACPGWRVLDVATHEQDIRGALGAPGARDTAVVRLGSDRLLSWLRPPAPLRVVVEDRGYDLRPEGPFPPDSAAAMVLRTDRFDAFRWRLGRRSRRQLADLDWTGDPSPVLDHLVVFGPAATDIDE